MRHILMFVLVGLTVVLVAPRTVLACPS